MEFEWDNHKSSGNLEKHGISFEQARALWQDINAVEVPLLTEGEERYFYIAKINNKLWTAVFCYRGNKIRLISVRRSRLKEEECYEQNKN